jgi:predicted acylesterase/phospholipase RssA
MRRDRAVTFAGGGSRTFYQLGLWMKWGAALEPRLSAVAGCSAGACSATVIFSGRVEETVEFWKVRRRHIDRNFEWERLLAGRNPLPQYPVYRDTLLFAYARGGLDRIRALPFPLLVNVARFPARLSQSVGVALGLAAYVLERRLRPDNVHSTFTKRVGFESFAVDARECESPEELADLVLASSATPPITPIGRFRDGTYLDGGFVDNAPAELAEGCAGVDRNLVLLTRHYAGAPESGSEARVYVAPSEPIPVKKWDYAREDLVTRTFDLGVRDGARRADEVARFLEPAPLAATG